MKVVIMAGGKGTRISSVASDIPKPMIKVEGVPVLEREIECLKDQGFDDIIMTVSHLGNIIMYYCGPDFPAARQAIKETLYATGIDLIVLDEGLDTRTASRKEVEDYFEAKRCEMHAEIMFAWRRKQGAGFRLTSSVPFGYIRRNGESNMIQFIQALLEANGLAAGKDHQFKGRYDAEKNAVIISLKNGE